MTDHPTAEIGAADPPALEQDVDEAAPETAADTDTSATPRPSRRRGGLLALALVPVLALGAGGAAWAQQAHKTVTVDVDGETRTVSTWSSGVSGALDSAGITLAEHDDVSPAATASIDDGAQISVRTAREVPATVDGEDTTVWTTAATTAATLAEVSEAEGTDDVSVALSRSAGAGTSATDVPLTNAGTVTVAADAGTQSVSVDTPVYASDVLDMAGVDVSAIDRVSATTGQDGDIQLDVTRVQRGTVTEEQSIAYETQTVEDDTLLTGTTVVAQAGVDGVRTVVRYAESVGGQETVSLVQSDEVTTEPVTEIIHVGTKDPEPEPTTSASTSSNSGSSGSSSSGSSSAVSSGSTSSSGNTSSSAGAAASSGDDAVWASIAQCESGGNPATNTGNGYYGLYQFSLRTWQAYGGTGLPSDASAAEQLRIAKLVQAGQGWGAWPSCARAAGVY